MRVETKDPKKENFNSFSSTEINRLNIDISKYEHSTLILDQPDRNTEEVKP